VRVISNFNNRSEEREERRVLVNRSEENDVSELDPDLKVLVEMPFVLIPVFLVISLFRQICEAFLLVLFWLMFSVTLFFEKYWLFKFNFQNK